MSGRNRLASETSPYLLQHADNPVDWYAWGDEAFARARAENKPLLVSIGYSACHWCHVMAHESFENPAIAALMNELFVNVKVDREERPDVDDVYMKAVQLLTGRGGWPLTVFCAPDGKPFHGGTYFPPTDRHGMPGFARVLQAVAQAYRERPDEVARAGGQLVAGVRRFEDVAGEPHALDPELPSRAADALLAHVDTQYGGLGGAPKFPHTQVFQLLLRQYRRTRRPELLEAVRVTCERMAAGGIYDHLGGGFHRYAVDARWLVPHFEKMLYDNAQIPRLYLEAFQVTNDPGLRRIVVETLDYVLRELRHPDGAFFSATDADSEGEEGRYFVWTRAEVARLVDPGDLELVCRYWDITDEGNFEGRNILHLTVTLEQLARLFGRTVEDAAAALARARERLLESRRRRVPPLRDEKILTAWNALMIGTLAEAGRVLRVPRYVAAAAEAARFLWSALRRDDRLLHVWASGEARQGAFLDDHAFLANALLDLYEADGDAIHIGHARDLVAALDAHFHDPAGAYYFTADDAEALIARPKPAADGALPSGNAVAAQALLRLATLAGEERYRARAEEILGRFHAAAAQQPLGFATLLQAVEFAVEGPTEVVVVSPPGGDGGAALWSEVAGVYLPHRVLVAARADDPEPLPLARDRPAREGRSTAYVCRNFSCSAPVVDPAELRRLLET